MEVEVEGGVDGYLHSQQRRKVAVHVIDSRSSSAPLSALPFSYEYLRAFLIVSLSRVLSINCFRLHRPTQPLSLVAFHLQSLCTASTLMLFFTMS
jgi:hypothetical protein